MTKNNLPATQEAVIASKIISLRDENVILDVHLAELYGVETRALKQAVRRNMDRFPDDFMFKLSDSEVNAVVSQNVIPAKKYLGGAIPYAFTDNGVAMLSGVLKSKKAIEINIVIMRTFNMMRKMLLTHKDLLLEVKKIKEQISDHGTQLLMIFEYLKQFEESKQQQLEHANRKRIGFKTTSRE